MPEEEEEEKKSWLRDTFSYKITVVKIDMFHVSKEEATESEREKKKNRSAYLVKTRTRTLVGLSVCLYVPPILKRKKCL